MQTYQIISSAGVDMGTYEAESPEAALDALARDAGYADRAEAAAVAGPFDGSVKPVTAYIVEHLSRTQGWIPLVQSTARTGYRVRPREFATRDDAEREVTRLVSVGRWSPESLRVAETVPGIEYPTLLPYAGSSEGSP